ncbi:2-octaprenyl-6-methoxyphenol hydroxylase [Methylocaldum marinum]|uniref:2-octaprenyl-6-methoxyphenol hydroxylase n=1 Tax=Methylocaldum marinum TaxID=1432792 RepID=A0A250KWC9_9GAMM|nr:2-octaprenyl-6-methoxyphenyl hydroxylase [Methylocaldum marinum]BBA35281.1 2-octaprenyl-6-methoxyphenol hydroxylase [Methylocaldum marinum]
MSRDFDLLIVGGGLVGGSLALALRDTPLRVGIVEALTETQRLALAAGDRALALARGTVQILDRLGIWQDVAGKAMPIRHIHVSDRGRFGKTRLHAGEKGIDALGQVIVARTLEDRIAQELQGLDAELVCPARVIGLKAGPEAVCVTVKKGDECLNLTASLVVAADGGNSTVRKLLEIEQKVRDYQQTAIVTEVATEADVNFTAYERFTSAGPLALLPLERRKCSVVWTMENQDADELLSESDSNFTANLQTAFGYWLGKIQLASKRQGFPLKLIRAEKMADDRVLLIGNAMHQIHPVAGQGFNLGLRDAAFLAEQLSTRLAFNEDIGENAFLARYVRARQRDLANTIHFTDSLIRAFCTDFPPLALARNAALVALDCFPPAKRLLARHAMGYGFRL